MSERSRKIRVAVYGGDERVERLPWPEHLDVRHYPYKSPTAVRSLQQAAASGSLDGIVILSGYVGHGHSEGIKDLGVPTQYFAQSPFQLSRRIGEMFPPRVAPPPNPLLRPTRLHENSGPGRGPLPVRMSQVPVDIDDTLRTVAPESPRVTEPMFERETRVTEIRPDEKFHEALRRLLVEADLSQSDLSRMLGRPQPTVSQWCTGKTIPGDMGPLIDVWPELRRFDVPRRRNRGPARVEEPQTAERVSPDALHGSKGELEVALRRWRDATHRLDEAKRELEEAELALLKLANGLDATD